MTRSWTFSSTGRFGGALTRRFSADASPGRIFFAKSRGSLGAYAAVAGGDVLGAFSFAGADATKMCEGAKIEAIATGAPGADYTPARLVLFTSGGSAAPAERLAVENDGALTMGGSANIVIDANRHHRLRSYTVAGMPSASPAGQMVYVSNEAGGAVPAFSDGTNWRRVTDRAVVS